MSVIISGIGARSVVLLVVLPMVAHNKRGRLKEVL